MPVPTRLVTSLSMMSFANPLFRTASRERLRSVLLLNSIALFGPNSGACHPRARRPWPAASNGAVAVFLTCVTSSARGATAAGDRRKRRVTAVNGFRFIVSLASDTTMAQCAARQRGSQALSRMAGGGLADPLGHVPDVRIQKPEVG